MNKYFKNFIIFTTGAAIGFNICGVVVVKKAIDHGYFQDFISRKIKDICNKAVSTNECRTEIVFDSRSNAEKVLDDLNILMEEYGVVRVADLYDLIGLMPTYTDNNYGWINLTGTSIVRVRHGYEIIMPKPVRIE